VGRKRKAKVMKALRGVSAGPILYEKEVTFKVAAEKERFWNKKGIQFKS